MEGTAAVARGSSMHVSPSSRKEWRAVAENHSTQNPVDEELEQTKQGQSDERTIYEQRREHLDVDFCSITVDGTLDNDILQQQIYDIARRREEVQRMEIELRAQLIARNEIIEMQNSFDAQLKECANAAGKLQEQLHERGHKLHELERKMEEKDRALHAIKLDNEAAWAKQDLLREQNIELATFRREHDHSEAERAQHLKQIHDLQEHIQEKDRQLIELQEQHRVAQETIIYKDEQLREAQAWVTRVREMDVFQSTANQTLQAELRERTEQFNQLWMGCQRQYADMERLHLHTIQQLQLELADARGRSGGYNDDSQISETNCQKDVSQFGQDNENQFDVNEGGNSGGNNSLVSNENSNNVPSLATTVITSTQNNHVSGLPIAPSSLLGMPSYLPPGQLTAMHPFFMHQQGVPHSVTSHVGHLHSVSAMSPLQQWQNQQVVSENSQMSIQDSSSSSHSEKGLIASEAKFNYEVSVNGQAPHTDYLDAHISRGEDSQPRIASSTGEIQSVDKGQLVSSHPDQSLQQISSQFHDSLRLNSFDQTSEDKEQNIMASGYDGLDDQVAISDQSSSAGNMSSPPVIHSVNHSEMSIKNPVDSILPEAYSSTGQTDAMTISRSLDATLLDERSLLACIVRTIPAGGRIHISSTLPNRLGKMLAPLHWYDYKKKYGKLDDFVASHPELFMIEGDYIQLREGAQKLVVATAAVAKVAAAAAAPSYSSFMPTVAVTPMAQSHRLKKAPSVDSTNVKTDKSIKEHSVISPNMTGFLLKPSAMQHQQSNGVSFTGGISNVKILSKSNNSQEMDDPEIREVQSLVHLAVGNGGSIDRFNMSSAQNTSLSNGKLPSSFAGKQQMRKHGNA